MTCTGLELLTAIAIDLHTNSSTDTPIELDTFLEQSFIELIVDTGNGKLQCSIDVVTEYDFEQIVSYLARKCASGVGAWITYGSDNVSDTSYRELVKILYRSMFSHECTRQKCRKCAFSECQVKRYVLRKNTIDNVNSPTVDDGFTWDV